MPCTYKVVLNSLMYYIYFCDIVHMYTKRQYKTKMHNKIDSQDVPVEKLDINDGKLNVNIKQLTQTKEWPS